jgi:hypothetical protein
MDPLTQEHLSNVSFDPYELEMISTLKTVDDALNGSLLFTLEVTKITKTPVPPKVKKQCEALEKYKF